MKRTMVLVGVVVGMLLGPLSLPSDVHAQVSVTFHSGATGTADGTSLDVTLFNNIGVQVSGTFVGTVSFEGRMEDASNWEIIRCINTASGLVVTATTTTGLVQCPNPGVKIFRARVSAYTSGTIVVNGLGTSTAALPSLGGGGGGTSTGIQNGNSFPITPIVGDMFFITNDSAPGACDAGGGVAGTLCRWNGSDWVAVNFASEADTLGTVTARDNTSTGNDESNPFEILGTGAQASYGLSFDRTSTGESRIRCKEAAGLNKCDYYRQLDAGFKAGFKDSSNNIDFEYTESTGKISAITVDARDSGVNITLPMEAHFPVATCQGATPFTNFDLPAANFPAATCDTGTNTQKGYLAFDASTDESFQDHAILPQGFLSVDVSFRYKIAATTGTVGWCAQIIKVSDGATSDPAFPAQASGNCVSDTVKGTTLQENVATISNVTCTSCAAGDHVYIRISRDADGGAVTDSASGDAFLLTYGRTFWVTH